MRKWIIMVAAVLLIYLLFAPHVDAAQGPDSSETVVLILGIDVGSYKPYSQVVVEKVQTALKDSWTRQPSTNIRRPAQLRYMETMR